MLDGLLRIAVIGSRTFRDYPLMVHVLDEIVQERCIDNITIVSGGAKGADSLAERYASDNCYELDVYEADWKDLSHKDARIKSNRYGQYDANAGHRRNQKIIDNCDVVVAFTNGSPGTANSIRKARAANKEVILSTF